MPWQKHFCHSEGNPEVAKVRSWLTVHSVFYLGYVLCQIRRHGTVPRMRYLIPWKRIVLDRVPDTRLDNKFVVLRKFTATTGLLLNEEK
jgi:hypothetical protein